MIQKLHLHCSSFNKTFIQHYAITLWQHWERTERVVAVPDIYEGLQYEGFPLWPLSGDDGRMMDEAQRVNII